MFDIILKLCIISLEIKFSKCTANVNFNKNKIVMENCNDKI